MTRILGVDPGTRILGYGIVERRDQSRGMAFGYLECGIVRAPARAEMVARLGEIGSALSEIIEAWEPDELVLEK